MIRMPALALAGLLAAAAPMAAQAPVRLRGRVLDAVTRTPVALAEVRFGGAAARTGDDGRFELAPPPGPGLLQVRRIGFRPLERRLDLLPGLEQSVDLELEPLPVDLAPLSVAATPGAAVLDGAALVRRGADLARALDGWEGIVVRQAGTGPAVPQLRGSAPEEVLVVVDGFPLNDPFTGRADLRRIASRDVERVELRPGARTAEGGRAVAGVIAVETRPRFHPAIAGWAGSHGALGGRIAGGLGDASLALSFDRSADGFEYDLPPARGEGQAIRRNARSDLLTVSGRWRAGADLVLRVSASRRGLPGTTTNPTPTARAEDLSVLLGARGAGALGWAVSLEALRTRARDSAPSTGLPYDSDVRGIGGSASVARSADVDLAGWSGTAELALDGRLDRFDGDGVRAGGASFGRGALRAEVSLRRGRLTVAPAVRLDVWDGARGPLASARADFSWEAGGTSLDAGLGSAVAAPVLADLVFREGVGVRINPDLRPERVRWELEGGIRQRLDRLGGHVSVRGFWGEVDDLVVWGMSPAYHFTWSPANVDVRRRGTEAGLELQPAPALRLGGTIGWSAVTYRSTGAQVPYRPRTTAAAHVGWTTGPWTVDARVQHLGSRPRDAANRLPPISLIHLSLERRFGTALRGTLDVRDLADRRAEFIAGHPGPGRTVVLTLDLEAP